MGTTDTFDSATSGTMSSSDTFPIRSNATSRAATATMAQLATLMSTSWAAVNALTAFAGGGQGSATSLSYGMNRITTVATAGDSVKLPAAVAGASVFVITSAALAPDVFPSTGDAINGLGANNALRQPANTIIDYMCTVAGTWVAQAMGIRGAKYTKNTTVGATTAAAGDLTGIGVSTVQAEYSEVGAANLTTRTATQMVADGAYNVGDSYVLEITNTSAGTTTLVAGTGVTLTGTMTLAINTTRRFNVLVNTSTTMTIQSTGTGTIS